MLEVILALASGYSASSEPTVQRKAVWTERGGPTSLVNKNMKMWTRVRVPVRVRTSSSRRNVGANAERDNVRIVTVKAYNRGIKADTKTTKRGATGSENAGAKTNLVKR